MWNVNIDAFHQEISNIYTFFLYQFATNRQRATRTVNQEQNGKLSMRFKMLMTERRKIPQCTWHFNRINWLFPLFIWNVYCNGWVAIKTHLQNILRKSQTFCPHFRIIYFHLFIVPYKWLRMIGARGDDSRHTRAAS